jgi:hypothetical protein
MLPLPYMLVETAGKVLETDARRRPWSVADPFLGLEVNVENRRLAELTASCYFVLPEPASAGAPWGVRGADGGVLSLLTIARGLSGESANPPEFLDSAALLEVFGGVYLHFTYDPWRSRFEVRMNAGSEIPDLLGATLEGAPPELVCGRLLELYVEVNAEQIFASVNDVFAGGDLALDAAAPSTGEDERRPWGHSPSGFWWVLSGVPEVGDERFSPLPPGLGLSDLRITLGSVVEQSMGSLAYSGALDHLVVARPAVAGPRALSIPKWEVRALLRHAGSLREIADDLDRIRLLLPLEDGGSFPAEAQENT